MLFFLKTNKQCCAEVKFADKVFSEFVFYAHEYMHPCMYISRLWFGFSNIYKQEFPTTPRCKIYVPNFFHCAQLSIRCQAQHPPKPRWHNSAWIWIPRINVTFTVYESGHPRVNMTLTVHVCESGCPRFNMTLKYMNLDVQELTWLYINLNVQKLMWLHIYK